MMSCLRPFCFPIIIDSYLYKPKEPHFSHFLHVFFTSPTSSTVSTSGGTCSSLSSFSLCTLDNNALVVEYRRRVASTNNGNDGLGTATARSAMSFH